MKIKKVSKLIPGDVFWFTPSAILNPELIGTDHSLTGADQVFIMDDYDGDTMLVNGGHELHICASKKVLVITHYTVMMKKMNL